MDQCAKFGSFTPIYTMVSIICKTIWTGSLVRARDDLTLFCHIYNGFLMLLIDFFCAEFKSDECQLEKFKHFCRFTVKYQF